MNLSLKFMDGMRKELKTQGAILASFLGIFWGVEILDRLAFQGQLDRYGIWPQQAGGLAGILFAPFLHGSFPHLMANTLPFLILGWLVMLQSTEDFWIVTALTAAVGGLGVWLFGPPGSVHIGSSLLNFGYLGFLLLRGYFQRNFASIFLSLLVASFYGSLVWGIFPSHPGISWQGHLFGFLGGILAAKFIAKAPK